MAIRSFRDIPLSYEKRTLILCDIDDTLMKWDKTPQTFYNQGLIIFSAVGRTGPSLHSSAESYARVMFHRYRQTEPPTPTDSTGFTDLIQRISLIPGSEIMFLTARADFDNITRRDFSNIGLHYDQFKVHFTGNQITKGDYIEKKIDLSPFDKVIFIDDLVENLMSVHRICPTVECYRFLSDT